ncbi:actin filament network formation [Branchiostoma belcheri]|nr:actin filament network formation [Branchiostoma belcheri]
MHRLTTGYNTLPAKPPRPMSYAAPGDLSLEFRPATFDIPPPPDIPPPDVPPSPSPREEEVKMEEEEEDEAVAMLAAPSEYGEASSAASWFTEWDEDYSDLSDTESTGSFPDDVEVFNPIILKPVYMRTTSGEET